MPGARVAVVTDSTAGLPASLVARYAIRLVPLRVTIGENTSVDGDGVTALELAQALRERKEVSTSRPSPTEFAATYRELLDAGASHVVSVHLSAALSGTYDSALLAAQEFGHGTVRVVDSRSTAMALGFAAVAAARRAGDGGTVGQVQGAASDTVDATRTLFYVDTLEYLRRGGRIGAAATLLGTRLAVKPLLQMVDGQITTVEKVRTSSKAVARLVELTVSAAGSAQVDLAVHHLGVPDRADALTEQLREVLPRLREVHVTELGPVVGAHLGPGALGTVVVRR